MFEKWINEKQTATDHDIENDFQISKSTLKKWRLANQGPLHFRLGDKILYPRVAFIEWFEGHIKNKKAPIVSIGSKRTKSDISKK
tara:strand:+ start:40 stop:294 length:255 start_codon:yes stop_codon:yes gene_type:complete